MRGAGIIRPVRTDKLVLLVLFPGVVLACDGGPIPLEAVAREATTPGNGDKVEVFVKTAPGVDVTVDNRTENTGESPNRSFLVSKGKLKLGPNLLAVSATRAGVGSKSLATATTKLDLTPKMVLHVQGADGATNEGTFTCPGVMCGATSIPYAKDGKLSLTITSDVNAKLTIEGKGVQLTAAAKTPVEVDLVAKLAQTPVTQNEDVTFPLTLEGDGAKLTENFVLRGTGMTEIAVRAFGKAASGPMTFPGEAPSTEPQNDSLHDQRRAAMVVLGAPSAPLIVVGNAKTFGDVDLVGIGTQSERKFPCPNGTILYIDLDLKVVNRRTGMSVGQKTISADRTTCPPIATTQPLKSTVREDDIKKVLADVFLKK